MRFADEIKKIRQTALLSQVDFSLALGVSFSTVNRWERGKCIPNYKTMSKIKRFCEERNIPFDVSSDIWEDK